MNKKYATHSLMEAELSEKQDNQKDSNKSDMLSPPKLSL